MGWLFALLLLLGIGVVMLRRRYGNVYAALALVVERTTGLSMATIVRALGILTLIAWAAVYLFLGGEGDNDLDALFRKAFQGPEAGETAE